jgi:hypothetical protein
MLLRWLYGCNETTLGPRGKSATGQTLGVNDSQVRFFLSLIFSVDVTVLNLSGSGVIVLHLQVEKCGRDIEE